MAAAASFPVLAQFGFSFSMTGASGSRSLSNALFWGGRGPRDLCSGFGERDRDRDRERDRCFDLLGDLSRYLRRADLSSSDSGVTDLRGLLEIYFERWGLGLRSRCDRGCLRGRGFRSSSWFWDLVGRDLLRGPSRV